MGLQEQCYKSNCGHVKKWVPKNEPRRIADVVSFWVVVVKLNDGYDRQEGSKHEATAH